MRGAIGSTRWLAVVGVVFGLVAAAAAFVWGAALTVTSLRDLVHGDVGGMGVELVRVMEAFLVAAGLLIFALGLFELFIGGLTLPRWLVVDDLTSLEHKLAGVVVLALGVAFLERVERGADARDALDVGLGVAPVAAVLALVFRRG